MPLFTRVSDGGQSSVDGGSGSRRCPRSMTVRRRVPADLPETEARELALGSARVGEQLAGKTPAKVVAVPGRLVNVLAR